MYISEFWCGAIATILVELSLVIAYGMWTSFEEKKHKNKNR